MNKKTATLISFGIVMAVISGGIWFLYNQNDQLGYGNPRWDFPHHMMFGSGGMGITMFIFWIAVIAIVVLLITGVVSGKRKLDDQNGRSENNVLDILNMRYAKGEIDKSQYEQMKRNLKS